MMKRCPYCAEEIQMEAVFCRYCNRKVTGILFRRIWRIVLLVLLVCFVIALCLKTKETTADIMAGIKNILMSLKEIVDEIKKGIDALGEYRKQFGELK